MFFLLKCHIWFIFFTYISLGRFCILYIIFLSFFIVYKNVIFSFFQNTHTHFYQSQHIESIEVGFKICKRSIYNNNCFKIIKTENIFILQLFCILNDQLLDKFNL
ncbi:hypothetical protein EDEG_01098 [Edhazardia aedis USNM 41457]|uniref:Transmembrane protein n=1 Tax=Edhazardia aedis (strain USNM 41457) TaxID=1003232 RepID=J9DTT7_EDHAE|nr:hypothetical protein EDEG_01098 [Edhazardia aedis USNM 41457]|eukprot:EJW04712.1 hypothetical protein EDEG_01098 [Edhazardia aedis USNM 41457]